MKIAIDAMGGDLAPKAVIEGIWKIENELDDLELILVGDEHKIRPLIANRSLPQGVSIEHCSEEIEMDDEPVMAVRKKKDSSLVRAVHMVRDGEADAVISAGNTGAFMASGLLIVGKMQGIDRPALAPVFPRVDGGVTLVLDVGANMDAKAKHLVQYAIMGKVYMEHVLKCPRPRVGLLNIGTEENKGNDLTKEAYPLLERAPVDFVGNVEARDVTSGVCDVLVCDGFSGNVLLKASEGAVAALLNMMKEEFTRNGLNKLAAAVLKPSLRRIKHKLDYAEYGGAPMLGLKGACIKAHGSSNAWAFANAIKQTRTFLEQNVMHLMVEQIKRESE